MKVPVAASALVERIGRAWQGNVAHQRAMEREHGYPPRDTRGAYLLLITLAVCGTALAVAALAAFDPLEWVEALAKLKEIRG